MHFRGKCVISTGGAYRKRSDSASGTADRKPMTGKFWGQTELGLVSNNCFVIFKKLRNTSVLLRADKGGKRQKELVM
jgi:hypothetical protein